MFVLGINLALRAGNEHYNLRRHSPEKASQLTFERDTISGKRCLVYREDTVTKTNDGGLANMKKERKVVWIFPNESPLRCPVRLVDKYMSLLPDVGKSKKSNFYLRSLEKPNPAQWYGDQPVGKNTLTKVVSKLLKSANLDGYFTNHSLRRTSATRLFQAGVDGKIVKEITGHVSDALNKYQVTSNEQKQEVSNVLQGKEEVQCSDSEAEVEVKKKCTRPPSLELSVTNTQKGSTPFTSKCSCTRKRFDLANGESLTKMINDLVSERTSRKAKIKLEIEFSD